MTFETTLTTERIRANTEAGLWKDLLLNDVFATTVEAAPDRTAIVDEHVRLTVGDLDALAERAAIGLVAIGIRKGDVVTVQLPNRAEFVVLVLALERIGAVINPVAPIFRAREMRSILGLAKPKLVVRPKSFRGFDYAAMYDEILPDFPSVEHGVVVGGDVGDETGALAWENLLAHGERLRGRGVRSAWFRPKPNDVVQLMFTSGTTGEPKGVMHTANTLYAGVAPVIPALGLDATDVCHMASTLGHQTGFLYGVHLAIHLGVPVVFQEVWNAATFLELVERERITFTMGATPFLADTLAAPSLETRDASSLRTFLCGGAPIPAPLAEASAKRLSCRLAPGWGMTEVGLVTTVFRSDPEEKIVTTDGRPYPGMEVAVRRDDGSAAEAGEPGELVARGAAQFIGYVQGRAFTGAFLDEDGWFSTGDLARMDADGFIRIVGRSKDLIIRGGENVPVKEIEDVLLRHPKVRTVALVGLPDERLGEIGCACVVPEGDEPPTLEELAELLATHQVTRQFWPERLETLAELPMTPSGKIQKFRLREKFS